jgi:hypothetical protein
MQAVGCDRGPLPSFHLCSFYTILTFDIGMGVGGEIKHWRPAKTASELRVDAKIVSEMTSFMYHIIQNIHKEIRSLEMYFPFLLILNKV